MTVAVKSPGSWKILLISRSSVSRTISSQGLIVVVVVAPLPGVTTLH